MIKLYQYPLAWGLNISPFALKLETWLRLSQLDYRAVPITTAMRSPTGKLPFIEDDDGSVLADSTLIIDHLKRTRQIDPDHVLTEDQRAEAISLQRLFEDHFYFILVYSRWVDPDGWRVVQPEFFRFVPPGLRGPTSAFFRRRVLHMLRQQGLGRHDRRDIYALGESDLRSIAVHLGNRAYFFGDNPTTIDTIAFGFLTNLLFVPIETELKKIGLDYDNLRLYCERLTAGLNELDAQKTTNAA